jgi:hypothetical protein
VRLKCSEALENRDGLMMGMTICVTVSTDEKCYKIYMKNCPYKILLVSDEVSNDICNIWNAISCSAHPFLLTRKQTFLDVFFEVETKPSHKDASFVLCIKLH